MQRNTVIKGSVFILFFVFALGVFMVDVWDPDFWWHLATGKWIVEHGGLPNEDPFSFTTLQQDPYAATNWVKLILQQYWLAQVAFYKIYSLFGFAGISVLRALILTCTVGIIVLILRYHKVHSVLTLLTAALSILILRGSTGERPQLFSFLFAALLLYLLERYRGSEFGGRSPEREAESPEHGITDSRPPGRESARYSLYAIPFLMAAWSNVHGGYIYGVVTISIYISSGWLEMLIERRKGKKDFGMRPLVLLTAVGIIAVAAACVNPNTYHGMIDHFRYRPTAYMMKISEMQPTYLLYREKPEYFGMLILLTLLILIDIIKRKRVDIHHILLFLFNTSLSLDAARFTPFFGISGSFLLGIYLKRIVPIQWLEKRRWLEGAALVMVSLVIAGAFFFGEGVSIRSLYRTGVSYGMYPYGSAQFLKTLPPRKIFNPYTWGGYLIWTLYPEFKVFIDGRGLNQEIFAQYSEVISLTGPGRQSGRPKWKAILDGYNIDYLLLAPLMDFASDWSLINAVVDDENWSLIYADNSSLVFVRKKEEFRDIIDKYGLSSNLAYATTAWQALEKVKAEKMKEKKISLYLVAAETFIRLDQVENAKYSLRMALDIDPQNVTVKTYAGAIGMKTDEQSRVKK